MNTERLTMAQAIVRFLKNQYSERDGVEQPFFGGCFGIFGHGNVAGMGQALQQYPDFRYYQTRNEQAMVHTAAALRQTQQSDAYAGLHKLDRPGRDQHGHRRGHGDDQPVACAAPAGRYFRPPQCGSGVAAVGIGAQPGYLCK